MPPVLTIAQGATSLPIRIVGPRYVHTVTDGRPWAVFVLDEDGEGVQRYATKPEAETARDQLARHVREVVLR